MDAAILPYGRTARSAKHGSRQMTNDDGGECFASGLILGVEARQIRTIEIEYPEDLAVPYQRNNKLGPGRGIAGDVAGKFLHVPHQYRAAFMRGRATDADANLYADAGGPSLKRVQHQDVVAHKVESSPIHTGQ